MVPGVSFSLNCARTGWRPERRARGRALTRTRVGWRATNASFTFDFERDSRRLQPCRRLTTHSWRSTRTRLARLLRRSPKPSLNPRRLPSPRLRGKVRVDATRRTSINARRTGERSRNEGESGAKKIFFILRIDFRCGRTHRRRRPVADGS